MEEYYKKETMNNYVDNLEFVGNFTISGQHCRQIRCKKEYYDFYAKRTIKQGELGGFINIMSMANIHSWIEKDCVVGGIVVENCSIQRETKQDLIHSTILDLDIMVKRMIQEWLLNVGTSEPSIVNAIIWKSQIIPQFIQKLFLQEEICIKQSTNINESDQIMLWVLLGAIQEALLKVHITVFRDKYSNFLVENPLEKIDNIKESKIVPLLEKKGDIVREEAITLDKIYSNRNMIHFISNRPIHNYENYLNCVEDVIMIFDKLFIKQIEFFEAQNIKR